MFRTLMLSLLMAFSALAPLAGCSSANAADEVFATADGAIRGYDPVAYHTESKAVPGKADITHAWNGATWRFASAAHRSEYASLVRFAACKRLEVIAEASARLRGSA